MNYTAGSYDVAVIGAGHAGIEAGLACARWAFLPSSSRSTSTRSATCPAIPPSAARERGTWCVSSMALGGEMAKAADRCCIQYRMLNLGKGPAVHSLRAQADRRKYQEDMKHTLERQENLDLKQAMVVSIA